MKQILPFPSYSFRLSLLLCVPFLIIASGVFFLTRNYTDETLRVSVEKALSDSLAIEISLVPQKKLPSMALAYTRSYRDAKTGAIYCLVSITGRAGPFPAVFSLAPAHASFISLVGLQYPKDIQRYGITEPLIHTWEQRLTAIIPQEVANQ